MNAVFAVVAISIVAIVLGLYLGSYLKGAKITLPEFVTKCYLDGDCEWEITNCCPESAGAYWECVNLKEFKEPDCPMRVICPQVVSPRPAMRCACEQGSCVTR